MIIVLTSQGKEWSSQMDPRFGRAQYLFIYNDAEDKVTVFDNTDISNTSHGAGPQTAQKLSEYKPDVLITGNGPGNKAGAALSNSDTEIFIGAKDMTVKEAYEAYKNNSLEKI